MIYGGILPSFQLVLIYGKAVSAESLDAVDGFRRNGLGHFKTFLDINVSYLAVLHDHKPVESLLNKTINGSDAHEAGNSPVS